MPEHHVEQVAAREPLRAQRQLVAAAIGAHQILHDAVELSTARRVLPGMPRAGTTRSLSLRANVSSSGESSNATPEISSAAAVYANSYPTRPMPSTTPHSARPAWSSAGRNRMQATTRRPATDCPERTV